MKIEMSMWRTTRVPTDHFLAAFDFDPKRTDTGIPEIDGRRESELAKEAFMKKFGPLSPGFEVFWGPLTTPFVTVGVKAMAFSAEQSIPTGGVIDADPMDQSAWNRLDGRIEGELSRFGIVTDPEYFEWRFSWRPK